jgi:excisionase family DNA binding protein
MTKTISTVGELELTAKARFAGHPFRAVVAQAKKISSWSLRREILGEEDLQRLCIEAETSDLSLMSLASLRRRLCQALECAEADVDPLTIPEFVAAFRAKVLEPQKVHTYRTLDQAREQAQPQAHGTIRSETLTMTQAGDYVGVADETIRSWIKRGTISAPESLGEGRYLFDMQELETHRKVQAAKKSRLSKKL